MAGIEAAAAVPGDGEHWGSRLGLRPLYLSADNLTRRAGFK